jgi:hypothetical protein
MKFLSAILSKVFGQSAPKEPVAQVPEPVSSPAFEAAQAAARAAQAVAAATPAPVEPAPAPAEPPALESCDRTNSTLEACAPEPVDVEAVMAELAARNAEKLDWKRSIVDLMKLVGLDSSLTARRELADELGFTGDKSDSASMNIWLHKQVLKRIAENGGKVPASLLD